MRKKLIIEEFIIRSNKVHNFLYEYNNSIFKTVKDKITITCKIHGDFLQRASSHLQGKGCKKCASKKSSTKLLLNTNQFIINASIVHNNKYDYSKVKYEGCRKKVKIICKIHGEFDQSPSNHLKSIGCNRCAKESLREKNKISSTGWSVKSWKNIGLKSKKFDSFKVYIIRCWNDQEEFYKIGRTYKKVKYRFSGKITMPYKFNIIYEIKGDAEIIFKEEQRLKDLHKEFRYTPKLKFHGMYECYNKIIK